MRRYTGKRGAHFEFISFARLRGLLIQLIVFPFALILGLNLEVGKIGFGPCCVAEFYKTNFLYRRLLPNWHQVLPHYHTIVTLLIWSLFTPITSFLFIRFLRVYFSLVKIYDTLCKCKRSRTKRSPLANTNVSFKYLPNNAHVVDYTSRRHPDSGHIMLRLQEQCWRRK